MTSDLGVRADVTLTGEERLAAIFSAARSEGRSALIGYLPAGFPTVPVGIEALRAMVSGKGGQGVDIVEVGLPYSDPLMDGPVIQEAVEVALSGGTHVGDVLATVSAVAETGAATLVMTYWNPIEQYGPERFAADLAAAGGAGVITPDLTPEEGVEWIAACRAHGLASVFLVAPSSTSERLRTVADVTTGFVYVASTMGVTGTRTEVSDRAAETVGRTRSVTGLPLAVGLGVSTRAQAATVAGYADGVIVGSAFVRALSAVGVDADGQADADASSYRIDAVRDLAGELAAGVREGVR